MADLNFQLRIRVQESAGSAGAATDDYELYYSKNGGAYALVTGITPVRFYNSASVAEGDATTNRLGAGSGSFVAGKVAEDGEVNDLSITASNYTELVYSLTTDASQLANADTIDFRVYKNGSPLDTYTATPRLTISISAGATFQPYRWAMQQLVAQ